MQHKKIIRLTANQIKDFVNAASRCDFDIDIANNDHSHYVVDAKSFLGVMGLNLAGELLVSYNGYNEAFERLLAGHALAC